MILVACIGNIFLGDDGFGVEVARQLALRSLPPDVVVKDFGIRGFDLTYALLDHNELTILVDACPRGGSPGTVYVVEPEMTASDSNRSHCWTSHSHESDARAPHGQVDGRRSRSGFCWSAASPPISGRRMKAGWG